MGMIWYAKREKLCPDKITSRDIAKRRILAMHVKKSAACLVILMFLNLKPTRGITIAGRKAIKPTENRVSSVFFYPRRKQKLLNVLCFRLNAVKQQKALATHTAPVKTKIFSFLLMFVM